jgi:hypothetical protein
MLRCRPRLAVLSNDVLGLRFMGPPQLLEPRSVPSFGFSSSSLVELLSNAGGSSRFGELTLERGIIALVDKSLERRTMPSTS